jgi:anaerobic selenocysteine-containing dehydrogenase
MNKISACILDCPDACSLLVDSQEKIIQGNPDHPFTRGFICPKGKNFLSRINSEERVTEPMLRQGSGYVNTTWDKALDIIAEHLNRLRSRPESILHVRGYGYRGVLAQAGLNFFQAIGSSKTYGSLCDEAGIEACTRDMGSLKHNDPMDILNACRIVNWGKDFSRASMHSSMIISQARKSGARVLTISPGGDSNPRLSDDFILIRPGSDRFLAAAIIKMFLDKNNIRPDIIDRTANWPIFRSLIQSFSLSGLLKECQVSTDEALRLFRWYQESGPTATIIGWGLQRYVLGGQNVRMINALALLSGNMGVKGGGAYYNVSSGRNLGQWTALTSPHADEKRKRRQLAHYDLGREIENARPEIEFIWVDGHNAVNQIPDSLRTARAFEKPFVVCVDGFLNDTALCSDVILPPALMLEKEEILGSCLHNYVNYSGKILQPRGSCRSDFEIFSDLGQRLTPEIIFPGQNECLEAGLKPLGTRLEHIRKKGFLLADHPKIAFQGLVFDHPDFLYRFPTELQQDPSTDQDYPLRLLSLIQGRYMHSQIPESEQKGLPRIFISESNQALPELDPLKQTYLATPLGRMKVEVRTISNLHQEAVIFRRDGWMKCGHGPNILIEPRKTDMGNCAAFYSQPCRIEQE